MTQTTYNSFSATGSAHDGILPHSRPSAFLATSAFYVHLFFLYTYNKKEKHDRNTRLVYCIAAIEVYPNPNSSTSLHLDSILRL